jgi:signal transduction histidine kinase
MSTSFAPTKNSNADVLSERWIDQRVVSALRLMLVGSALLVVLADPPQPHTNIQLTYITLALYTLYSAVVCALSIRRSDLVPIGIMHWLDIAWYIVLIALTGGPNSIFFNFFFFAILVGSFGWGLTTGLRLTLVSAILFTIVAFLVAPSGPPIDSNRIMLRPMQLLILGYMISRWGEFKINLRNQLQLLKDVTVMSNPRFGIDRSIAGVLESLRAFYDAEACLLLVPGKAKSDTYNFYRVRRGVHSTGAAPPEISSEAAAMFLLPSSQYAIIYRTGRKKETILYDLNTLELSSGDTDTSAKVASALDTTSYLSVPVHNRLQPVGRLYVIDGPTRFDRSSIDFVLQFMEHVTPLLENIRLVDSLASDAAEQERRRIARDIHDSVIQPYLGIQLGIAALARKLQSGSPDVLDNVEELLELTNQELAELRRYVWDLRAGEEKRNVLLPSIQRYATRFASVTGINVDVKAHGKIEVNDRLAAELFQIVAEGLSNVRRHALCNDASVEIMCKEGRLFLEIKNRRPEMNASNSNGRDGHGDGRALFMPRSIAERAELLGGNTRVSIDENNYTVVKVVIPL